MNERFIFKKNEDSLGTDVSIGSKELIGGGAFGDIYLVGVTIEGDPKNREIPFAIKHFKEVDLEEEGLISPEKGALNSLEVYSQLKELGIPTWKTYRISGNNTDILMTLAGNREGQYIIDIGKKPTNEDERLRTDGVEEIINLEETVGGIVSVFKKIDVSVEMLWDSFFQIYDSKEKKLYPIVGDFDSVYIGEEDEDLAKLVTLRSLVQFLDNIKQFVKTFVSNDQNRKNYINYIDEQISYLRSEFSVSDNKHKDARI